MTCAGCSLFTTSGPPVEGLPAHLPRECQRLAVKVPDPGVKVGDDMVETAADYRAAWIKANHRIGAVRGCEDHQADAVDRGAK